ncbi:MAG: PadR family transcriptional regulator [Herpetosiphonaceae bacterium]|nr:PadR family transcriptional regulator [Herpetosiphonaceae bacterium]
MIKLPLTLEHALLGFLVQRPMHAYEMYQRLQETSELGLVWHLKQSQLYALLGRLEEAGYITTVTEPQGTRPPRKVLHLTPNGRTTFSDWLRTPVVHGRDFRQEFLAKLYFAEDDPLTVAALLDGQRNACQDWLTDLHAQATATTPEHTYDWLVLQFRIGQMEAISAWLDTCALTLALPQPVLT